MVGRGLFLARFNRECQNYYIWIRLPNLELNYWGSTCLHKLGDSIETTLKLDHITLNKERLTYARLLIEVGLEEELPDHIWFVNEKGIQMKQAVEYEWRPTLCTNSKRYGNPTDKCNKKKGAPKPIRNLSLGYHSTKNKA
ncbi:Regulator of nonsense transcripts UPF3 [Bienertia sinuspersici]